MSNYFPAEKFKSIPTPFYFYDMGLLEQTLQKVKSESDKYNFVVHYAIKANANDRILERIREYGMGVDCVSGFEVKKALDMGFPAQGIVFAGVGKADWEIEMGIDNNIACFNVESTAELDVINEIATRKNQKVKVAMRINPNVKANTHKYITTGLDENKFGIHQMDVEKTVDAITKMDFINLEGIHFHIGSQIMDLSSFSALCERVNEIQDWFEEKGIALKTINVGGGLGIDYNKPAENPIPDFENYFRIFSEGIKLRPGQEIHFELGRSVVGQCGNLISKVLYVKEGVKTNFAIIDGGMTDLIRPALYQAYHKIENITSNGSEEKYDVVGPICESSDSFGKDIELPKTSRGDLMAIRSAGAYGEVMVSRYNLREEPKAYYSDQL
ncbi:diaminopimelate decarboxylase [Alkalitalea saponilacus]|uniref:Diaminopimelate decarboxylase n=1 Tax=Alkalitalea saponilacus TaxID=889453 RepID=A0A1T5AVD5_9BACT|nr:diaminopimelate decarboxylase [Alkalitalea saponilacus]ASB48583.1 diaminopimelate decarboxylase [Alkalitalea saponilacus]SKB38926.1 diaminopimelate decarboxylase [Alkalitalea saponilacus]